MSAADPALTAAALLGAPVDAVEPAPGAGRNSRVYRVRRGSESFALKLYPTDNRDRLQVEVGALELMAGHGIGGVPRVIAADRERGSALLEWMDGDPVGDVTDSDIDEAVAFLASIHALRRTPEARRQPLAAEACLSGTEIVVQIERRLARLSAVAAEEPALAAFLRQLRPLFAEVSGWAEAEYRRHGFGFAHPLPEELRALCPSDFGFHNALRRCSGQLAFVDFDYFGWDDPVKLCADFLLHPGMRLSEGHKHRFTSGLTELYAADVDFADRLRIFYPLFGLRWCLILLNEFLPERWARRLHAGAVADWAAAKTRQLDRAGQVVHSLGADFRRFPYG